MNFIPVKVSTLYIHSVYFSSTVCVFYSVKTRFQARGEAKCLIGWSPVKYDNPIGCIFPIMIMIIY
jgi:hypothetical protein